LVLLRLTKVATICSRTSQQFNLLASKAWQTISAFLMKKRQALRVNKRLQFKSLLSHARLGDIHPLKSPFARAFFVFILRSEHG